MFIPHNPEKLLDILRNTAIIVEGKNDKKALKELEIKNIFTISGKSIEDFIQGLEKNYNYVVLTDFDSEGEFKNKKICKNLERFKLKFNPKIRFLVKDFFGITKIEELIKISKLKALLNNGRDKTNSSASQGRGKYLQNHTNDGNDFHSQVQVIS